MGHGVTVLQEEGCLPFWFVSRQACQLVVMATALHCRCLRHTKHTPKSHKVFFVDLLQPDSGSLSLQLNQCRDGMVRVDGLFGFQEIQKDHCFSIPKDCAHILPAESCILNFFFEEFVFNGLLF